MLKCAQGLINLLVAPMRLIAIPIVSFPLLSLIPLAAQLNEAIHYTTGLVAMLGIFNSQARQ
jgi:hypothetical protein